MLSGSFCKNTPDAENTKERIIPKAEYTLDEPGEWEGMDFEHVPKVKILPGTKQNIQVKMVLINHDGSHYIERIGIMDENKKDLAGQSFSKNTQYYDIKLDLYPIPKNKNLKVYAKCNLHDLWTVPLNPE